MFGFQESRQREINASEQRNAHCGNMINPKCKCPAELFVIKCDLFKGKSPIKPLNKT